ncbi:GmrSD restriction endonuclease domain-containing protein [Sessilibacter sp. MAH4]
MTTLLETQQNIQTEIVEARRTIKTDDYSMSIGELINLYKDGEITLDPAFQRLFRWEREQKTKLVESILIGIPVPGIFVAQKTDGTWHVVDGVQRLSTIFQLVGELKEHDPLKLTYCKYIPSLENKVWGELPTSTQREFKKSKIRVNIILTENSDEAQYELFQRLNTGGTELSEQEVRNCLMLMIQPKFYEKINTLKNYKNYLECINSIKEHQLKKEFHMELILRMIIGFEGKTDFRKYEPINKSSISDFIDQETIRLMDSFDIDSFESIFNRTFDKLKSVLGESAFKKFDTKRSSFSGPFNVSVFEMITSGFAKNIDSVENIGNSEVREKIEKIYSITDIQESLARGIKPIKRFKELTSFSRKYFK